MTNLKWLDKLKRDDDGYSDVVTGKLEFRTAKALEIIAETLIGIKEELNIIANCQKLEITRKL